ncbi:MAG TPA: mechanosensitive ion channel family protein [Bacillota bacterium]|nr:mechanosensitive ion channel family protein [Bacillota bacterium]
MNIYEWIHRTTGVTPQFQQKLVLSVLITIILRLILTGIRKTLPQIKDSIARYELNKIITGMITFTGVMLLGRVWFQWFGPWTVFVGIIIGALIVALQEILFDLAGWVYIVWRRPFEIGDWIAIGDETGEVLDDEWFHFTLRETNKWEAGRIRSGRIINIPNAKVFREKLVNYSKGYQHVWNEFAVQLTVDSNWQKAKEILRRVVSRYAEPIHSGTGEQEVQNSSKLLLFYNKLEPEMYTEVNDGRIVLTTRFLCELDKRRITLHGIWEDVLREFQQEQDIQLALPQTVELSQAVPETAAETVAPTSEITD